MATRKKTTAGASKRNVQAGSPAGKPRCVAIADRGIKTGADFARMMSMLIGDVATDRIDARRANAICNAGGKLLKVVEMQHRYASGTAHSTRGILQLTG